MTTPTKTYQSISCSYYDQLEAYATKRTECEILFSDNGNESVVKGIITDIFAKDGAEYLKMNNALVIRLDKIISINGIPVNNIC